MAVMVRTVNQGYFYLSKKPASSKEKMKRIARYLLYLFVAAVVALAITVLYTVSVSNTYFNVKSVKVTGVGRLSYDTLISDLKPFLAGNIFTSDISGATEYLKNNPWIAFASIRRKLPDSLVISITERYPVAVVQLDKLYLIDSQGYLLGETEGVGDRTLLYGIGGNAKPGDRITDLQLTDAYRLIDLFSNDTVFNDHIVRVDVSVPESITVRTASGKELQFGTDRENWSEKFLEYLTVRKILADRGTEFSKVNLSFGDYVVVERFNDSREIFKNNQEG